jgi:hypothetical protein
MPPNRGALSPLKGMGFGGVNVVIEGKSFTPLPK